VDRVHKPTGFIKVSIKAAHYRIFFIVSMDDEGRLDGAL
jgi:hypothetical protein